MDSIDSFSTKFDRRKVPDRRLDCLDAHDTRVNTLIFKEMFRKFLQQK